MTLCGNSYIFLHTITKVYQGKEKKIFCHKDSLATEHFINQVKVFATSFITLTNLTTIINLN